MGFASISKLKDKSSNKKVINKKKIVITLLLSIFPPLLPHSTPNLSSLSSQLQMPLIINKNIKLAIFTANPYSARNIDSLALIV